MSTLSKFFDEQVRNGTCNEIVHDGKCINNMFWNFYRFFLSNAKYYLIVLLPSVGIKARNLNAKTIEEILKYYLGCTVAGSMTGWIIATMICYMRYIFGEFGFYTFLFWPSFIGAGVNFLCPPRVQRLQFQAITQGALEGFFMRRRNAFTRLVANSVLVRTLGFCCCSSAILHAKQNQTFRGFWLLEPNPKKCSDLNQSIDNLETLENENIDACEHPENCRLYLLKGVRSYCMIGLFLDSIKALFSKKQAGRGIIMSKLCNFKLTSTPFLITYIGLYRYLHCYLNNAYPNTMQRNHLWASFLSGFSYILYPKLSLLSFSIVTVINTLLDAYEKQQRLLEQKNKNEKQNYWTTTKIMRTLQTIVYMVLLAHSVHTYSRSNTNTSVLSATIINATTDSYAKRITERLETLKGYMP